MKIPRIIVLVFFFSLVLPAVLFARDIAITVMDEELDLPLEGAVVALRGGQQFVCDGEGMARITLPDERQTVIQVSYPGYETTRMTIPAAGSAGIAFAAGLEHFTAFLRLGGVMMGRELVVEAERPETSETKSGRSVAISERELSRTAEIGIIEDVMGAVKLLPGVGYTGMFGAMPSIRGGDPGDLMAAFDGFYLERPYHWVGAVSIFDPKMVSSARLSHGVFSSRYGHTISGLLEINSKSPSETEVELETGISTSAASLNLSVPLNGKGGILFMGKVTYWDTFVWAAQGLSRIIEDDTLDMINSVSTPPYIRSAALSANYRFSPDLEWRINFFFGSDGVGASLATDYSDEDVNGSVDAAADYNNYQGFLISGITASPSPAVALKFTGGVGFMRTITDDMLINDVTVRYNDDFLETLPSVVVEGPGGLREKEFYTAPGANMKLELEHTIFNAQGRADIDWELGNGFITAFGIQELYSMWEQKQYADLLLEISFARLFESGAGYIALLPPEIAAYANLHPDAALIRPAGYHTDLLNHGLTSSAYGLLEYSSPNQRFGAELGLRVDHLYFKGRGFSAQTMPTLNPRLNIDVNILRNKGSLDSLDFTVGTGLFSSINPLVSFIGEDRGIRDFDLKFNRAWTSIAGVRADVMQGYSFNIEGYYKHIFDHAYTTADLISSPDIEADIHFDGIGNVWGFDLQLQKLESRYWDGWISYTFTWAQYYDPSGGSWGMNTNDNNMEPQWYYPSFHRFHNCNIVLNFKPLNWFNISTRFGFASGRQRTRTLRDTEITSYPAVYVDENGETTIVQKYHRKRLEDEDGNPIRVKERDPWSLPWDIKFSFFLFDKKGRVGTEIYLAIENLMSLFLPPQRDSAEPGFNEYTGREYDTGTGGGYFDFPIPMVSFGFKWRY